MAQFDVKIDGAKRLAEMFARAPKVTERWAQRAVNASMQEVFKRATPENLPWLTGRLTRSFGEGIVIGRLFGTIGPTVDYALKVHEKSSKPNYMPRILAASQPDIVRHFDTALANMINEYTSEE